jgi:hypothetical protein
MLLLLLRGQLASGWFLLGGLAMAVQFLDPLITAVGSTFDLGLDGERAPLAQCASVLAALAYCDTEELARLVCDDDLRFLGMTFLLPAVVWPLFFGGRSMGLSATSTTITAMEVPPTRNFFLPGT